MATGITRITIEGYKSIVNEQSIEIAPLTILAGANSSGKSSMIQPLLLLKQTLEAPFNPGPLLINGPILKFTSSDQFLSGRMDNAGLLAISIDVGGEHWSVAFIKRPDEPLTVHDSSGLSVVWDAIGKLIHVRGLRGNPERNYPVTAFEERFPGIFELYIASIIELWQIQSEVAALNGLNEDLCHLELNTGIAAHRLHEAGIELKVKRAKAGHDLVNIADVGFGVSQGLPILVALRAAKPGQMVYIEQPELHLHPRAQTRMADILANAAKRGVRVVVETHSSLLLTSIQTLVAKGELPLEIVRLHWFQQDTRTGATEVTTASLDENGAFGGWPEDFDDVILSTDKEYLDAVESRIAG